MIEFNQVNKIYKNSTHYALKDVSFRIKKGELIGVIGRNGAGKSTLFKIISGILSYDSGTVAVEKNMKRTDAISYLPETRGIDCRGIVIEHLSDLLGYKGIKISDAKKSIQYWLKEFEMEEYADNKISSLSKGNQQKLQFISAVANNPEILILDEPFSGLDIIATDFFWKMIKKVNEQGTTILFSTHNLQDKMTLCENFMFIVQGEVVKFGSLNTIQNDFKKMFEIVSDEISKEQLFQYISIEEQERYNQYGCILIENEEEARNLFEKLGRPFCEKIMVRKQNIEEIFRGVNGLWKM